MNNYDELLKLHNALQTELREKDNKIAELESELSAIKGRTGRNGLYILIQDLLNDCLDEMRIYVFGCDEKENMSFYIAKTLSEHIKGD